MTEVTVGEVVGGKGACPGGSFKGIPSNHSEKGLNLSDVQRTAGLILEYFRRRGFRADRSDSNRWAGEPDGTQSGHSIELE
jgi:hypothetical protein